MRREAAMTSEQEAQTAELYCLCMEANQIDRLIGRASQKLAELIGASVVTYLDIQREQLHVTGQVFDASLRERINAHARRCLEGSDKAPKADGNIDWIQHSEISQEAIGSGDINLLWTGAIDRKGSLVGVITLYAPNRRISVTESRLLRSARTIIGESIQRLNDIESLRITDHNEPQLDMFVVTIDPEASRGDVTGLAMSKLQDAVANRLASKLTARHRRTLC